MTQRLASELRPADEIGGVPATLYDYAGAIHIRSTLSDGTGTVPEIIGAAQHTGLDFLVLTDHEHLAARDLGFEGWHGDVLMLVGEEVTPRFHNHYLAFNIRSRVKGRGRGADPQSFIDEVAGQGGLGFLAHPIADGYPTRAMAHPWLDWSVTNFTGLELWSYMHDWVCNITWKNLSAAVGRADEIIRGPHRQALSRWDRLGQDRRIVAIGTLDVHAKRVPGLIYPEILPYAFAFRTIRTHVLTTAPLSTKDASCAASQVYEALGAGRCYLAHDGFGDSTGFQFSAERRGDVTALMGDEIPFASGLRLTSSIPEAAHIRLLRDGNVIEETDGKRLAKVVTEPGVYRIEVRRRFRPWIFSNPIYVRPRQDDLVTTHAS